MRNCFLECLSPKIQDDLRVLSQSRDRADTKSKKMIVASSDNGWLNNALKHAWLKIILADETFNCGPSGRPSIVSCAKNPLHKESARTAYCQCQHVICILRCACAFEFRQAVMGTSPTYPSRWWRKWCLPICSWLTHQPTAHKYPRRWIMTTVR